MGLPSVCFRPVGRHRNFPTLYRLHYLILVDHVAPAFWLKTDAFHVESLLFDLDFECGPE